jgi:signal transduction histidine kinase
MPANLVPSIKRQNSPLYDWLADGGEMGKVILSMDWAKNPLGTIELWPQSLRTTVSLCLASNFPISLAWGPRHVQIYNDGYWPICGEKHPEAMGQDFRECWASAWPVIGEAFEAALTGKTSYLENQRMFLDRNGYLEETFFTFSFSPIRDETGVAGLFHPVTETTNRMLSERRTRALRDLGSRALKANGIEEACALAAETLSDYPLDLPFTLFYLLDDQGKYFALTACTGLPRDTIASPILVLNRPQSSSWPLAETLDSGQTQHVADLRGRFGSVCCGEYPESLKEALALPITPPGCERPVAVLVVGVSSRLPLNETYRAFYDLLAAGVTTVVANARAYAEERRRVEALAEIDRAKTAFFSNVSHEFRTPLTLMLAPLEDELAEGANPLPPARHERLQMVHRNSLRLLKLVNSLLDFSRLEAGRAEASYQPTDLAVYTAELASVFRSAIEKAGLSLLIDCPPLPEHVYVDREMWEKIVLNLLANALKHTFAGGIAVRLRARGEYAELSVEDTGVGIAENELPRLFERFHRVKGAKSRTHEGTGIGLALVKELAALHGGTVSVQSQEDKGTIFAVTVRAGVAHLPPERLGAKRTLTPTATVVAAYVEEALQWLPSAAASPLPGLTLASAAPQQELKTPGKRTPRILWCDDNADMREYVRRLLAEHYEVLAVADGFAALAAAQNAPPDLVLTDIMMPGLDGLGLLRELRTDPRTRTIPVILLSARAGGESTVEGLEAGADDYLTKPFSAPELLARVRTHLDLAHLRHNWAKELERANQELESFSYSVSHDLRAPLRAIDGFSKVVLDEYGEKLDEHARQCLRRVRTGAEKMSLLINDLLNLSRVSRSTLRIEPVNLTSLARSVEFDLRQRDPARKIEIDIADGLSVRGDRRLLSIACLNLLENAWKYTANRPEARVVFGQENQAGEEVFFVRDNGAGFDMAYTDKLFGPFQRLHRDTEFEGTGIGLATVQRVISRHRGRIWAEGAVNQGATFFFTLGDLQ